MEFRWRIKESPDENTLDTLEKDLKLPRAVCHILWQRNIRTLEDAKLFFRPKWEHLHDPFLMKDMDKAIARILSAMDQGEKIMVFGDYDVDGTTAVSVLSQVLSDLEIDIITHIPDRYKEGYGLSKAGIDEAIEQKCSILIALDCGVKAVDLVDYAVKSGLDVIIGDHHTPGKELPPALAILDPKRNDCDYPYDELCGCGIAFKISQALFKELGYDEEKLSAQLDLVALAIGADIVPITGENRVLAHMGMKQLNESPRPGIQAFMELTDSYGSMSITDVVFRIAPRINAAGRIDQGALAVDLLREMDLDAAREKAKVVHDHNSSRQHIDRNITESALQQIVDEGWEDRSSTMVYNPDWHKGVVGIVASRLTEKYYRPTVVLTKSKGVLAGSARSVSDFDLYAALDACSEHLIQFGGHKFAAGMTLKEEKLDDFRAAFEEVVQERIEPYMKQAEIVVDMEIDLDEIDGDLYKNLNYLAPFGPGNPRPIFVSRELKDTGYAKRVGADASHLKLCSYRIGGQHSINGIGFKLGDRLDIVANSSFNAAYHLNINEWNGKRSLQLEIKDIKE